MLTAPNKDNHPIYAAKDINNFYLEHTPKIFPQKRYYFVESYCAIQNGTDISGVRTAHFYWLITKEALFLFLSRNNFLDSMTNLFGAITGPKYDGVYLSSLVKELLGDLTIKQTLADVIIPTFDIKRLQPVIFSTDNVRSFHNNWNICIL